MAECRVFDKKLSPPFIWVGLKKMKTEFGGKMKRCMLFSFLFLFLGTAVAADSTCGKDELYDFGGVKTCTGKELQTISFPIGGLGTGNINLGGRGDIREIEIFIEPNKGVHPDMAFFSIWVRQEGEQPAAKILERKLIPPYVGWTGIEYQVAASLIYSGHIDEGLTVVKAVRDRHRGFNRNPWDEFECGHHYARAMASWAVLLALSGYRYDGVTHSMSFSPRIREDDFFTFWSTGSGWGSFEVKGDEVKLKVEYGTLEIESLGVSKDYAFRSLQGVQLNSQEVKAEMKIQDDSIAVVPAQSFKLTKGNEISLTFAK